MTVFSYETELPLIKFSSNSEERNIHSYNESSAVYVIDEDFGSITASVDTDEDYGSITDTDISGWNAVDYGLITINQTLVPYGPINIGDNDIAAVKLVKVGIGDVTFTILGEAFIFTTPIEKGSGRIRINGTSGDPRFSLAHVGTGSLFAVSSTTEVKGSNPPEETVVFRFTGSAVERIADAHVGSGSLFTLASKTETFSSAQQAQGLFRISGSVAESISPTPYIGSGKVFAFTGSSESTTADPPDSTLLATFAGDAEYQFYRNNSASTEGSLILRGFATTLFSLKHLGSVNININGSAAESDTSSYIGTGRIFSFTGSSESITGVPPTKTELFRITGTSVNVKVSAYEGSGEINLNGSATTIFKLLHVGSGSLFGFSSTTESISVIPPKETALFRFSGTAVEKNTESYVGSGSLFTFITKTESSSSAEESKGLFKIAGASRNIFVINNIGSGSLFGFSSTTESIAVVPPKETALFKFTGSAVEKNTESYQGSGSLFGFSSATETTSSAEATKGLFKFNGSVAESITPAPHIGSGKLFAFGSGAESKSVIVQASGVFRFIGSVVEKKSRTYVGTGSLFGFSSTAESFAIIPPTFIPLFKISGSVAESFIPAPHIGSGALRAFSSATETRAVFPKSNVLFEFHGNMAERSTRSQLGSGSLFGITGSYEATKVISQITGVLFNLFGFARESITPATEIASGITVLSGASTDRKVVFVPAKPTRIIII
jgi:hypothetical protein